MRTARLGCLTSTGIIVRQINVLPATRISTTVRMAPIARLVIRLKAGAKSRNFQRNSVWEGKCERQVV
jgi:hypothetical protein